MFTLHNQSALRDLRRLLGGGRLGDLTDAELLGKFAGGRDEAAFAALVTRHGPIVLAACRGVLRHSHDAEDALQATFLVLARKANSLRVDGSLAGWLYRVAFRVALQANDDAARRRARERRAGEEAAMRRTGDVADNDRFPSLFEEISKLPELYRLPIVLCYLEGLPQETAAHRLDMSEGTFRRRLSRAREVLRTRLARAGLPLAGGALFALLGRQASGAAVPGRWAEATVRVAMSATSAHLGPGLAADWAMRVLQAMASGRWLWAGTTVMGVVMAGAGAVLVTVRLTLGLNEVASTVVPEAVARSAGVIARRVSPTAIRASGVGRERIYISGHTTNAASGIGRRTFVIDPERGKVSEEAHPEGSLWHWRSSDGSLLAWLTAEGEDSVLWNRDARGRARRLFQVPSETSFRFVFSPDGRQVILTRYDGGPGNRGPETWRVNSDGTGLTRLSLSGAGVTDWSPDGSKLLVIAPEAAQPGWPPQMRLLLTDADDRGPHILRTGHFLAARYAPDGRRIAVLGQDGVGDWTTLSIMGADGSELCPILKLDHRTLERLCWSPDGQQLALQISDTESGPDGCDRLVPGSRRIEIASVDGRDLRRLDLPLSFEGLSELEWR